MLKQVMEILELLDDPKINGVQVAEVIRGRGLDQVETKTIKGEQGSTDLIKIIVPGMEGKQAQGNAATLGIIGRLGGIGARPERVGIVSDADGAIAALACALKMADMTAKGDLLRGDLIITTQVCPEAPTQPHDPVPFMGSPVDMSELNANEVDPAMDAILSVDSTKGNRIINSRGIAITPTVKEGYILRISEDLLDILSWVTGRLPCVCPITTQDITPYGNGLYHMNSIVQPCAATTSPVVGIAVTAETVVPGCGTGANHEIDIAAAARFCVEVGKAFTEGKCAFCNVDEFGRLVKLYGKMTILQTLGTEE